MKKKLNRKLQLKKSTIAKLADDKLTNLKGGYETNEFRTCGGIKPTIAPSVCICTTTGCIDTLEFSRCIDTCACP